MANFGTAYLQIIPSLKGGVKGLESEINRADIGGRTGREAGGRFGSGMGDVLKTAGGFVLAKAALAVGDTVGSAFTLGLDRYMNIENAEAKLGALGHSADTVAAIMDNALKSVEGTSFGLGEAADTAASLVAAGIAPGKELEGVLTTIANTAAVAGADMNEMGAIFGKVASSNKLQGGVIAQLEERSIPVVQNLIKELGVSSEEVYRMASAGEIDFETFQKAMQNGMAPDAAVQMGDTLSGTMDNLKSSLGRFGGEIMKQLGPGIKKALDGMTDSFKWLAGVVGPAFDWVTEKLRPAYEAIKDFFNSGGEGTPFAQGLNAVEDAAHPLRQGLEKLREGFGKFWEQAQPIIKDLADGLREWWEEHGPQVQRMAESMVEALGAAMENIGIAFEIGGKVVSWFWGLFGESAKNELGSSLSVIIGIIETAAKVISGHFKVLGGLLTGDWAKVSEGMKDITGGMEIGMSTITQRLHDVTIGRFESMYGGIVSRAVVARDGAITALGSLRDGAVGIADNVRDWVIGRFQALAGGVRDAAQNARNWFGTAFDGIKAKARQPVEFVINTVYNNGLRAMWNKVAVAFDMKQLPEVGFAGGGWTGPGGELDPAGFVHADEFVVKKKSRKRFEDKFPGFLSHINDKGTLPGYATGGQVAPVPGRGKRHSGYGWTTWAGDFPQPMGTPVRSWKDGVVALVQYLTKSYGKHVRINHTDGTGSLYAHLSRISAFAGQAVKAGHVIGNVGSTGNSSGPHLHFETTGGPFKGGAAMSGSAQAQPAFSSIKDVFGTALDKLSTIKDTKWGQLVAAVPQKIASSAWDKIKNLSFGDDGMVAKGTLKGAGRWAGTIRAAMARTGMPDSMFDNWMRQVQSESGGNPRAVQGNIGDVNNRSGDLAKGLLQVIGTTFAAYRDPSLPNDRFNPLANAVAAMNYVNARYPKSMERMIGAGHGYLKGGVVPFDQMAALSEDGRPELVVGPQMRNLRAGSRVFNAGDTAGLMSPQIKVYIGDREITDIVGVEVDGKFQRIDSGHSLRTHHAGSSRPSGR